MSLDENIHENLEIRLQLGEALDNIALTDPAIIYHHVGDIKLIRDRIKEQLLCVINWASVNGGRHKHILIYDPHKPFTDINYNISHAVIPCTGPLNNKMHITHRVFIVASSN